ncbi:MAG: hypothetical protein K6T65_13430 [Peptococcaceae bacterium]|nr:hypothetical protein [Peptococcaceae bacterium]
MSIKLPDGTPPKFPQLQTRPPKNLAPGESYPGPDRSGDSPVPEVKSMSENKNVVLNSNFPQPAKRKGDDLPLPSLEDVRDSEKTEFFSVNEKD